MCCIPHLAGGIQGFMEYLASILHETWAVAIEAVPWLLIGLIAAGLIQAFIPTHWMTRVLGKRGIGSIVRAALIGTSLRKKVLGA